jgi:hypothetical protein
LKKETQSKVSKRFELMFFSLKNIYAGNHPIGISKDLVGRNPAFQRLMQEKFLHDSNPLQFLQFSSISKGASRVAGFNEVFNSLFWMHQFVLVVCVL